MKVYLVGNMLVKEDSLPIRLLPKLRMAFPHIVFEEVDPNENFIPEEGSVIMDTVYGITKPRWFTSIDDFEQTKSVSPHDYDLAFHLKLLVKLKKISHVRILGIPMGMPEDDALSYFHLTFKKWVAQDIQGS